MHTFGAIAVSDISCACRPADQAIARAAIRDLLISKSHVDIEVKTAHATLGLPDSSIILREDHLNSAIWAGTGAWLSASFDLKIALTVQASWFLFPPTLGRIRALQWSPTQQ